MARASRPRSIGARVQATTRQHNCKRCSIKRPGTVALPPGGNGAPRSRARRARPTRRRGAHGGRGTRHRRRLRQRNSCIRSGGNRLAAIVARVENVARGERPSAGARCARMCARARRAHGGTLRREQPIQVATRLMHSSRLQSRVRCKAEDATTDSLRSSEAMSQRGDVPLTPAACRRSECGGSGQRKQSDAGEQRTKRNGPRNKPGGTCETCAVRTYGGQKSGCATPPLARTGTQGTPGPSFRRPRYLGRFRTRYVRRRGPEPHTLAGRGPSPP